MKNTDYASRVCKWDVFEVEIEGPMDGNPFTEQKVSAVFSNRNGSMVVEGFYDGEGIYKVRFMPSFEGKHTFVIRSSFMSGSVSGAFYVDPAKENNFGPVRTSATYHFAYENGEPYRSVGTTAYVWALQDDATVQATLKSLKEADFNKVRFCVFPKHYEYNFKDPAEFPYEGTAMDASVLNQDNFMNYLGKDNGSTFDHERFNPSYFERIERCIAALAEMNIEADLILFHPYDRWGFSCMSRSENELYLRYVINRFSAYHNVWWALANEWDLIPSKSLSDWNYYGNLVARLDPYQHLRSIHNCRQMFDHSRPWITHASVQRVDLYKGAELTDEIRTRYNKPVVMDEIAYEGNLPLGWGNITAEEMVRRFWETAVRGGYPGHGETYLSDDGVIWWSHGGTLKGESYKRVGFLHKIMSEIPGSGIAFDPMHWDCVTGVPEDEWMTAEKSQYIFYYSFMRPSSRTFMISDTVCYKAEIIDTWDMTITDAGCHKGKFTIELPQKQYMAIRLTKMETCPVKDAEETETAVAEEVAAEEPVTLEAPAVIEEVTEEVQTEEPAAEEPAVPEETVTEAEPEAEETPAEPVTEETAEPETEAEDDEDTQILELPAEEAVEEVPDRNADEIVEKAVEESIPAFADMLNTLSAISEFAEDTPLSTASIAIPEEEDDVDLTLKLEELLEEKAVETEAEDEAVAAEETPVEEEDDEDDDSLFDLGETEAEIENTISMLKLSAAQTNSYFDTRENRMAATEQMDGFDDDDVTGKLRAALASTAVTGENEFDLEALKQVEEEPEETEDEEELPDIVTGKFPFISELTKFVFGNKN